MNTEIVLAKVNEALITTLLVSAPVLFATVVIGVVVGLIQALTQIQDQTLPQALKLMVVLVMLLLLGPLFGHRIAMEASALLDAFPVETR
jgi:type III secretion protein S